MNLPKLAIRCAIGVVGVPAVVLAFSAVQYSSKCGSPKPSCLAHRQAGCSIDGNYPIQIGTRIMDATCEMKLDGGGWTLVGNYLHQGSPQSTSAPLPLNDRLPLQGSLSLGGNEDKTIHWGHAGTLLLSAMPFKEVRFNCRTNAHDRTLDFAISSKRCLDYFRSGKGGCFGKPDSLEEFRHTARTFLDHNGVIPQSASNGWADQGENAMTHFPFFQDWKNHWSVNGIANRWECDDFEKGGATNTLHQIWVR